LVCSVISITFVAGNKQNFRRFDKRLHSKEKIMDEDIDALLEAAFEKKPVVSLAI